MNPMRWLPAGFALALGVTAAGYALAADTTSTVPTKRPPDQEVGQALWVQSCAACHGTKGLGDGPLAAALGGVKTLKGAITADTLDGLVGVVRNGKDKMPAFSETIDAGDTRRVLEWIRDISDGKIQPKAPKAAPASGIKKPDVEGKKDVEAEAADEE